MGEGEGVSEGEEVADERVGEAGLALAGMGWASPEPHGIRTFLGFVRSWLSTGGCDGRLSLRLFCRLHKFWFPSSLSYQLCLKIYSLDTNVILIPLPPLPISRAHLA